MTVNAEEIPQEAANILWAVQQARRLAANAITSKKRLTVDEMNMIMVNLGPVEAWLISLAKGERAK